MLFWMSAAGMGISFLIYVNIPRPALPSELNYPAQCPLSSKEETRTIGPEEASISQGLIGTDFHFSRIRSIG